MGIESLDQLAGAEANALAACCHKNVKIDHLLLCEELVGLDITEELTLRNLTLGAASAAALPLRAEAPAQSLPSPPPHASATPQPETREHSSPIASHTAGLHAREEERTLGEGPLPLQGKSNEGSGAPDSWMDAFAFPQPSSVCLSTQNQSNSRERSNSNQPAVAAAAASAANEPAALGVLHPPPPATSAGAATATATAESRTNHRLQPSPAPQQSTRMLFPHAEKASDRGGLPLLKLLPAATSTNRVETSGEHVTKKPRKEMNFVFLGEWDI
ncbi:hypothetical protein ACSSS7_005111 [Eimeria intestinalis]